MATLSEASIRAAEPPAKARRIVADQHKDAPRGFALWVEASGTRSFVLRYKSGGRDRLLGIGEWPTWSLAAARRQATEFRRRIDAGEDILQERRDEAREVTVAEAVERYCSTRTDQQTRGRDVRRTLERYFVAELGTTKLRAIRRRDVIGVVESLAQRHGRTAALLLIYTKGLMAWAAERRMGQRAAAFAVSARVEMGRPSGNDRSSLTRELTKDDRLRFRQLAE